MGWALIAGVTAICIAVAHHLGLVEKMADVAVTICACAKCSVFWGVLGVLILEGANVFLSAAAALACAYLTDWAGLFLNQLAKLYLCIWDKQNNRSRSRRRRG